MKRHKVVVNTELNIGNEAGKETDTFEEVPNASKVDMLSAIIEAVKSRKMTLETVDKRSKASLKLGLMP